MIRLIHTALAAIAWAASYIWPVPGALIQSKPDRAVFLTSQDGRLIIWTQQISPAPPAGATVKLTTPHRVVPQGKGQTDGALVPLPA